MSPGKESKAGTAGSKCQTGSSSPAVRTTARPTIGQDGEERLVGRVRDDVLLGHELEEVGDGLEEAEAAGVGRAHPVLEPGVDLPVEPLAEGGVDEEEEEPGIDEQVEEGFQSGHTDVPFHECGSGAARGQPPQVAEADDPLLARPGVDQLDGPLGAADAGVDGGEDERDVGDEAVLEHLHRGRVVGQRRGPDLEPLGLVRRRWT